MFFADFWPQTVKSPRKRQPRRHFVSGVASEALETRQLLSAANCVAEPEAAEIAPGAPATFDPIGNWEFTVSTNPFGITAGTATIAAKGKKAFTAAVDAGSIEAELTGKRTKDDPNLIFFKGAVKLPEVGKVKLFIDTDLTSNTTFDGVFVASAKTGGFEADIEGEKIVPMSSGVPTGTELFDPVGSWEIFVGTNPLDLTSGAADVAAKGKKAFTAEGNLNGVEFSLVGKRQKSDPNLIFFKGAVKLPDIGKTQLFLDAELSSNSMFDGVFAAVNKKNEIGFETTAEGIKLG